HVHVHVSSRSEGCAKEFGPVWYLRNATFAFFFPLMSDHYKLPDGETVEETAEKIMYYKLTRTYHPVYNRAAKKGRKYEAKISRQRGLALAEKHLKLNPDDSRALYLGAGALLEMGARTRSLEWVQRALAMDPDEPLTLYNVACNYSLSGRIEEAIDCLERA